MQLKPLAEIEAALRPVAEGVGAELCEVRWDRRTRTLLLVIDAEGGVDMALCEAFHHAADAALDEIDPTCGAAYTLTCSSRGLDHPFTSERDYKRHMGEKIEVHLYAPYEGAKYFEGILTAYEGGVITIDTPAGEKKIPQEKTCKVCLYIDV